MGMVLEHVRKLQLGAAEAEIDRGNVGLDDETCEVVIHAQPCQYTVALPTPWQSLVAGEAGRELPIVFQRVSLDAAMQAVIIPTERDQHSLAVFSWVTAHASAQDSLAQAEDKGGQSALQNHHIRVQKRVM